MKRIISILLCLILLLLFAGCGKAADKETELPQSAQLANPWSSWASIAEAEREVGFSFGPPEVIAETYIAEEIRTMNSEMIEVIYRDEDFEVRVRKQSGEGQDISGDYNKYAFCSEQNNHGGTLTSYYNSDNNAVKQIVSYQGYSWSFVAPNGYWGDSNQDFLHYVWNIAQ